MTQPSIPPLGLGDEAVELLREIVRMKTVNPPGDELDAQRLLRSVLSGAGFDCSLVGAQERRVNLVARLAGDRPGPVLAYLGHMDTVPADPSEWSMDPFGAEIADGQVWGRGTVDMKGQVACEVAAAAALARGGWRPAAGELKVIVTCDEEVGGRLGARWLTRHEPDAARADYVVNEGAGQRFSVAGHGVYTLGVGEKGAIRFSLTTEGRAGHASTPKLQKNALQAMLPVLDRLFSYAPEPEIGPSESEFLRACLGEDASANAGDGGMVRRLRELEPRLDPVLDAVLAPTFAPTMIRASDKVNVVPSSCRVWVDCRVAPGRGEEYVREHVERAVGRSGYALDLGRSKEGSSVKGNRSPSHSPLRDAIETILAEDEPGARLAPLVVPFFSDSNWFRDAFDSVAYGFCPFRETDVFTYLDLLHAADEHVAVADIHHAASFFHRLAPLMLGSADD